MLHLVYKIDPPVEDFELLKAYYIQTKDKIQPALVEE